MSASRTALTLCVLALGAGCAVGAQSGSSVPVRVDPIQSRYGMCDVPPGHQPPPDQCRIWYPDRPPGQQPPAGNCHVLERRVPPDACLIYGDAFH